MIVKRQRRQSESSLCPSHKNNNSYTSFLLEEQDKFERKNIGTNFTIDKQPILRQQRKSMGSVTKANDKIFEKKYDYSATFEQANPRNLLSKTNNKSSFQNNYTASKQDMQHYSSSKQNNKHQQHSYYVQNNERKRCSSVKNNVPKYKYTENYLLSQQNSTENHLFFKKPTYNHQLRQSNKYLSSKKQSYEQTFDKENRPYNTRSFFTNNKYQNTNATQKLIEFKTQPKSINLQQQQKQNNFQQQQKQNNLQQQYILSKSHQQQNLSKFQQEAFIKYEPKYSKIRNNKRSSIINKSHQYLNNQIQQTQQQSHSISIDFQQLYKNSQSHNQKISQKIQRITQLNTQINRKLQNMLNTKKIN